MLADWQRDLGLNAPFGARCFLTTKMGKVNDQGIWVLMHLMALGAF